MKTSSFHRPRGVAVGSRIQGRFPSLPSWKTWWGIGVTLFVALMGTEVDAKTERVAITDWDSAYRHDFGKVSVGESVGVEFELRNSQSKAVTIRDVKSSCSCLKILDFPRSIPAKGSKLLVVWFEPEKPGNVAVDVTLETESPSPSFHLLRWTGVVGEGVPESIRNEFTVSAQQILKPNGKKDFAKAIFVDVRSRDLYDDAHLPAAIFSPLYAVKTKTFLKARPVVLVDEGLGADGTLRECRKLKELGFAKVGVLEKGLRGWIAAGGPLEGLKWNLASRGLITAQQFDGQKDREGWLVLVVADTEKIFRSIPWSKGVKVEYLKQPFWNSTSRDKLLRSVGRNTRQILIVTEEGSAYDQIEYELEGKKLPSVFYLRGGLRSYATLLGAIKGVENQRTVTLAGESSPVFGEGRAQKNTRKCGSCP